jgi:hypothetical protein
MWAILRALPCAINGKGAVKETKTVAVERISDVSVRCCMNISKRINKEDRMNTN